MSVPTILHTTFEVFTDPLGHQKLRRICKPGSIVNSRDDVTSYIVAGNGALYRYPRKIRMSKKARLRQRGGGKFNFQLK